MSIKNLRIYLKRKIVSVAEAVDGTKSGVAQCCNGKIRMYKGFRFRHSLPDGDCIG